MATALPVRLAYFEVSIPWTLATPNSRLHWAVKARKVAEVRTIVGLQALSWRKGHSLPPADGKRGLSLVLVRGKGQRFLDGDNATATCKPMIDGLRDAGLILDDTTRQLDVVVGQDRGDTPALRVSVWAA